MDPESPVTWRKLRDAVRDCSDCQALQGILFQPFSCDWPELPEPKPQPILFVSEAPPTDGGFWVVQPKERRQDGLRTNLLPLLGMSPAGETQPLKTFRDRGYFLLQSFQRPLKFSINGVGVPERRDMLDHHVAAHLKPHLALLRPRAIQALGKTAAIALSMVFPQSSFASALDENGFKAICGQIFPERGDPDLLAPTHLPAGPAAGFFRNSWTSDIPAFLARANLLKPKERS